MLRQCAANGSDFTVGSCIQVNDEPFSLVTLTPSLTVADGWRAVITSTDLLTVDADTPPDRLRYDVIIEPEVGHLTRRDKAGPILTFSQADVNERHVEFVHNMGNGSGSFIFQVVRHGWEDIVIGHVCSYVCLLSTHITHG